MTTVYVLRYLAYKSKDSDLYGVFTSKEAALTAVSNYDPDPKLNRILTEKNKFYDGNGYYVIDEIKINTFHTDLNYFLL